MRVKVGSGDRQHAINLKRSFTRFLDQLGHWYILDSAAVIMPAVSDRKETFLFRMSATLDHPVRIHSLQQALERTATRYPYFLVELRRGFFWYFMQPTARTPRVVGDSVWPCMDFNVHRRGQFMFRVRASGTRVACEFNHALTDGTGAISFLQTLLVEYFTLCGVSCRDTLDIPLPGQPVDDQEFEDAYHRYFKPDIPWPRALPKAYRIPSKLLKGMKYRITTGKIPFSALSALAKRHQVSINDVLVAALMSAWLEDYHSRPLSVRRRGGHSIGIEVPVNLRKFYPSRTLRNFSLYVMICLDARLGVWDFGELVKYVHHAMRLENNERFIAQQIARNSGGLRYLAVRLTPLFLKDFFGRIFFHSFGQSMITSFISNLGPVELPAEVATRVSRFDFIPAPNKSTRTNVSVISWRDTVYVNCGSRVLSRSIEQRFFSCLAREGLPVSLDPVEEDDDGFMSEMRS